MIRHIFIALLLAIAQSSSACPMCASGGPADYVKYDQQKILNAVRKLKQWSVGLDARTISSSEGVNSEETHRQSQIGAFAAYRPSSNWFMYIRAPYSATTLTESDGNNVVSGGIGDAELQVSYDFKTKAQWWPAVSVGVKVPTGDNNVKIDSGQDTNHRERLDEHGQVGTGGWDGMIMFHLRRSGEYRFASTAGFRANGENDYGYRFGNAVWLDLVANRIIYQNLSAGLGTRLRHTSRNNNLGESEFHSGGTILLLMPEVGFSFGESLMASMLCTIPALNNLNGSQSETLGLSVALTQTF